MTDVDDFIVIDNGVINEQDDFKTLMYNRGLLYQLYQTQTNKLT